MTAPPATSGTSNKRIQRYGATSRALALLSNRQLGRVLDAQPATADVTPWAAAIIARYAPVAVVLNDFYWSLFGESRKTRYPTADIGRACARPHSR